MSALAYHPKLEMPSPKVKCPLCAESVPSHNLGKHLLSKAHKIDVLTEKTTDYLNKWLKAREENKSIGLPCLEIGKKRGDFNTCFACKKTYEGFTNDGNCHSLTFDAFVNHYKNHPTCEAGQVDAVKKYLKKPEETKEMEELKLKLKRCEEKAKEDDELYDEMSTENDSLYAERKELRRAIALLIDDYSFESWKDSGYSIKGLFDTFEDAKHRLKRHQLNIPATT